MPSRAEKVKALALRPGTQGEGAAAASALTRVAAAVDQQPGRKRLTDSTIAKLLAPSKGNRVYYDLPDAKGGGWTAGFGLRITAKGAKAFVLNYRSREGRAGRVTIGSPPEWSTVAARARAGELKRIVDAGGDPAKEDRDVRAAATVSDLCDRFVEAHFDRLRTTTRRNYETLIRLYIKPQLGARKVAAIEHADIDKLHRAVTRAGTPVAANRCVALISKLFATAIRQKLCIANPALGIERNAEHPRHRYLSEDELSRLKRALAAHPDRQAADILTLLLFTGARKTEVLSATWDQFAADVWVKAASVTKQARLHRVPLSPQALALLKSLRKVAPKDARFLFPGSGKRGHRVELTRDWRVICKAAGIEDFHVHDLRHSFASFAVSDGASLPIVGALLGHSQARTTQRYSHIADAAMRAATGRVGDIIAGKPRRAVPHG